MKYLTLLYSINIDYSILILFYKAVYQITWQMHPDTQSPGFINGAPSIVLTVPVNPTAKSQTVSPGPSGVMDRKKH